MGRFAPRKLLPLCAVTLVAAVGVAEGRRAGGNYGGGAPRPDRANLWQQILNPHADEVKKLVGEGRILRDQIAAQYYDPSQLPARRQVLADALKRFEQAAALDPDDANLAIETGHLAFDVGDWDKAIRWYLRARELRPEDTNYVVTFDLAECYVRTRRWEEARDVLERGLPDAPTALDRSRGLVVLGYVHMAEGRLEDAIDAFTRATSQQQYGMGPDWLALASLAVAFDRDEQLGRAAELLEQVRQIDPNFNFLFYPVYYPGAGAMLPASQRAYIPFSPPSDKHYWLALAYEAQGKLPEAAVEWRAYAESVEPPYERRAREHLKLVNEALAKKSPRATDRPPKPPRKPPAAPRKPR